MKNKTLLTIFIILISFTSSSFGLRALKGINPKTMVKEYGILVEVHKFKDGVVGIKISIPKKGTLANILRSEFRLVEDKQYILSTVLKPFSEDDQFIVLYISEKQKILKQAEISFIMDQKKTNDNNNVLTDSLITPWSTTFDIW